MGKSASFRTPAILMITLFLFMNVGLALASGFARDNLVDRIDLVEQKVFNANLTGHSNVNGFQGLLRNLAGQNVHAGLSLNTNSCASCHLTHTAPGERVLFQSSIYNTCTSCHFDSVMGTYNILLANTLPGGRLYDRDFIVEERPGASYHLATGKNTIGLAPGANPSINEPFTCASCHAPHGSYSGRNLNVNPNGQAKRFTNTALKPVSGKPGRYKPDLDATPWLYYDSTSPYFTAHGLVVTDGAENPISAEDGLFVHYRDGYVEIPEGGPQGPYKITFSQAMVVDIEVIEVNDKEDVIYRSGTVEFCTACHAGYLGTENGQTVTYHENFSHTINEDLYADFMQNDLINPDKRLKLEKSRDLNEERLVCLTCHFAHGTDGELMVDRDFNPMYSNGDTPPEQSFHLRFGQRDGEWESCYVCHGSGGLAQESTSADEEEVPGEAQQEAEAEEPQEPITEEPMPEQSPSVPQDAPITEIPQTEATPKKDDDQAASEVTTGDSPHT